MQRTKTPYLGKHIFILQSNVRAAAVDYSSFGLSKDFEEFAKKSFLLAHSDYIVDRGHFPLDSLKNVGGDHMAYYDMANYMTPEEAGAFDINTVRADVAVGKSRLVGVNLWHVITDHPNEASPLAICDNATMARADAVKIGNWDHFGAIYVARYNEKQEWCFLPRQTQEEVLVIKQFDTGVGEDFMPVFHTAVKLPGQDGKRQRESIEPRAFLVFDADVAVPHHGVFDADHNASVAKL